MSISQEEARKIRIAEVYAIVTMDLENEDITESDVDLSVKAAIEEERWEDAAGATKALAHYKERKKGMLKP